MSRPARKSARQPTIPVILAGLEAAYGPRPWRKHHGGVDGLVQTMLSQNTSDVNSNAAFATLKRRFPKWESLLKAPVRDIERAIRHGGLSKIKAPRIKKALQGIVQQRGRLSLAFLSRMNVHDARCFLENIDGVGPKTACCVLMFCYNMPALPVDTHVHRVALRLQLIPTRCTAEQAHDLLREKCPTELVYPFHMLMVEHGRQTCKARRPLCNQCPLHSNCAYWSKKCRN